MRHQRGHAARGGEPWKDPPGRGDRLGVGMSAFVSHRVTPGEGRAARPPDKCVAALMHVEKPPGGHPGAAMTDHHTTGESGSPTGLRGGSLSPEAPGRILLPRLAPGGPCVARLAAAGLPPVPVLCLVSSPCFLEADSLHLGPLLIQGDLIMTSRQLRLQRRCFWTRSRFGVQAAARSCQDNWHLVCVLSASCGSADVLKQPGAGRVWGAGVSAEGPPRCFPSVTGDPGNIHIHSRVSGQCRSWGPLGLSFHTRLPRGQEGDTQQCSWIPRMLSVPLGGGRPLSRSQ